MSSPCRVSDADAFKLLRDVRTVFPKSGSEAFGKDRGPNQRVEVSVGAPHEFGEASGDPLANLYGCQICTMVIKIET